MTAPLLNPVIKLLDLSDYRAFFDLIDSNRDRLLDFFAGTCKRTNSLEDTEQYCVEIKYKIQQQSYFPFMLQRPDSGEFIGFIDIKNIDWHTNTAEVGYFIDGKAEGAGLMVQAVQQVFLWLSQHTSLKHIYCRIHESNQRSLALAQKLGFKFECILPGSYVNSRGETIDLNKFITHLKEG
ncbi:GNAT family N-acetyltransferase [Neptunicella marina]|uniref:GNAT family N-acetyltransferase n=1 Tax=Neptunicella marina TaxID=2125989 RepID=A0A8J6M3Q5_9ALTE|nr:GNAT family protein [Neptunicella marina]MBC3765561.1 GNAT family N-acetyltransferase [Neptunicella marina]